MPLPAAGAAPPPPPSTPFALPGLAGTGTDPPPATAAAAAAAAAAVGDDGPLVYNFSFGSNLSAARLATRSAAGAVGPVSSARALLPGWHLAFDLIGAPPTEPLMASVVPCGGGGGGSGGDGSGGGGGGGGACSLPAGAVAPTTSAAAAAATAAAIAAVAAAAGSTPPPPPPPPPRPDAHAVHGILYAFTPAAYARLVVSEGGALAYAQLPVWVFPYAAPAAPVRATVFVTLPRRRVGGWPGGWALRPSARYRSLVLRGAVEAGLAPAYRDAVAASCAAAPVEAVGVRAVAAFFFVTYFCFVRAQVDAPLRAYKAVAVPAYAAREAVRGWAAASPGGRGGAAAATAAAAAGPRRAVAAAAAAACTAVMVAGMAPFAVAGVALVAWGRGRAGVVATARAAMNPHNSIGRM
ncbi:hypothetical protein I4F81_006376 [Pyropia yezoensis]|uniref:Uncharacterized protein n=1 Tax=Pyropia yezoensis TaxID=2788 RepID=A0ACC3C0Z9_PYRYE|nr:hypothetical protein I4F81_006376 [Neopyropia yezoensis]